MRKRLETSERQRTSANGQRSSIPLPKNKGILADWVSQLPDDILVNIISRLTVKEAARTSVLSTRWKYLWTRSTILNLDASENLLYAYENPRKLEVERYKYMIWVTKVLELHQGHSINECRVVFDLKDFHKSVINYWIYIAILKKGVEKFELNFRPYIESGYDEDQYTFSPEFFNDLKTIPHFVSSVKSLRSVCLEAVNISQEILEFFIYNCPLLDQLRVAYSSKFSSLKVVGTSIQLKYLDIHCCYSIEEIEISVPSLLSFKYIGREIKLHVNSVPQLLDVSIGTSRSRCFRIRYLIEPIISFLPQLRTLELHTYRLDMDGMDFLACGALPKLRHLTVEVVFGTCRTSLVGLVSSMMKACPNLHKLTLKLPFVHFSRREEIYRFPKCSHQHLKVVEMIGFCGFPVELELAFYLLENATLLEKMIVQLSSLLHSTRGIKDVSIDCTKTLMENMPQGVELVIR